MEYIVCIAAFNGIKGNRRIELDVSFVEENHGQQIASVALNRAKEVFPPEDGWVEHFTNHLSWEQAAAALRRKDKGFRSNSMYGVGMIAVRKRQVYISAAAVSAPSMARASELGAVTALKHFPKNTGWTQQHFCVALGRKKK